MPLSFACPKGHPISCDESFSGKPAKCPQCSVKFVVPPPGQKRADPLPKSAGEATGEETKPKETADKEDEIVFLCPNGHKLNGPKRLQGKAGQCPECGAKFRIPIYEEGDEEAVDDVEEEEEILTGEVVGDDEIFDAGDLEEIEMVDEAEIAELPDEGYDYSYSDSDMPVDAAPVMDFVPTLPDFGDGTHAMCSIFLLLWQQRHYGGAVEMQLAEGDLLNPDYFSPELSQATHGVFATQGKDGTFTIVSVPWDKVLRVTLRKTDELPPGLFDA
jgi:hypothetical protein